MVKDIQKHIESSNLCPETKAFLLLMLGTGRDIETILHLRKKDLWLLKTTDFLSLKEYPFCIDMRQDSLIPYVSQDEEKPLFSVSVERIQESMNYLRISPEVMKKWTANKFYNNALAEFKKNDPKMLKGLPDDFFNSYALKYLSELMGLTLEEYRELLG